MERQRTSLFVALLLLSPLTATVPFLTGSAVTTTYTATQEQASTYTSATTQTYYGSTEGPALIQTPFNLTPKVVGFVAPKGKCSQYIYPLTVTSGTIVNLGMTSTYPANLYLLPTYAYQTSPDGCDITNPPSALLSAINFTTYLLHWTAPIDGTFYLILTGPTTMILLMNEGSTQPVQELANITYATSTQTDFNNYLATSTATYTTTTVSEQQFYIQPHIGSASALVAFLTLIACFGVGLITVVRRRRS